VLWVYSVMDERPTGGAQLYNDSLAAAVVEAGHRVRMVGFSRSGEVLADRGFSRVTVPLGRHSALKSVLSPFPLMIGRLPLRAARKLLIDQLDEGWDTVVISHLFSSWALRPALEARSRGRVRRIVYVSQNTETEIWRLAVRSGQGGLIQRLGRAFDYVKVRAIERRVLTNVDAVTAITADDAASFRQHTSVPVRVARPGWSGGAPELGPGIEERPRSVLVLGSILWSVKHGNLVELLEVAADRLRLAGVEVVVAGSSTEDQLTSLRAKFPTVQFLGSVADPRACYDRARLAILHEPVGGGFKMKVLDYAASGLPVVATHGSVGLSDPDTAALVLAVDTVHDAIGQVIDLIDDFERLDTTRRAAAAVLAARFRWAGATDAVVESVVPG